MRTTSNVVFILLPLSLMLGGCSQRTINSANSDAQHDAAVVTHAAKQVVKEAQPQIKKVELGTRVSAALEAADIHGIRVDSSPEGVTLTGKVKSGAQKTRVMQIARNTLGPGKSVTDRVTVSH